MNILIVDDEPAAIRDLARVLNKVTPESDIEKTDNVEEAISICHKKEINVAFLDIEMPEKDGLSLARELTGICPMINIVMVTAYEQYAVEAFRQFVSGYILKPAVKSEVCAVLANLRNPVPKETKGLFVRCFGNFEVFYDG